MTKYSRILHYSLFLVSLFFTMMLFLTLANSLESKVGLILLSVLFEYTKLFDLKKLKDCVRGKLFFWGSYILKVLLSIFASVGFILILFSAEANDSKLRSEINDVGIEKYESEVEFLAREIEMMNENESELINQISSLPPGFATAGKIFSSEISSLKERKMAYQEKYRLALDNAAKARERASEAHTVISPSSIFTEMGLMLNVDGSNIKIIVFSLIFILLEISLATTGLESPVTHSQKPAASENKTPESKMVPVESTPKTLTHSSASNESVAMQIVRTQAQREKNGEKLMTQVGLSESLNISRANVNNLLRRRIRPAMIENGISSYVDLYQHLKKA